MKACLFIYVLCLISVNAVTVETVTNCESRVELRAVLLSCPAKDTGCDDDDPLAQAMAAEEAQILQSCSKSYRSLKDEKERGFPNAVKDCKRKLIITLKVKNVGKIPCDDEYIVVDHVFDPLTGGRGRLLTPVVLKLRQEQMIQLYGLQFQRVVNSDPFEEEKESEAPCSVEADNPTCGIALYDGKPIPFSEGFCCSCDPQVNTKRQLSPVSRGDSFLYRDSKLISQRMGRFSPGLPPVSVLNPGPIELRGETTAQSADDREENDDGGNDKEASCPMRGLSYETLPNYLMEHDRQIVCDKDDFLADLCKLREEKNFPEPKGSACNGGSKTKGRRSGCSGNGPCASNVRPVSDPSPVASARGQFNGEAAVMKTLVKALSSKQGGSGDGGPPRASQVIRGKRENPRDRIFPDKVDEEAALDENLEKFADSKHLSGSRRKRLLKLPHQRLGRAGTKFQASSSTGERRSLPPLPRDDYVKAPPSKFFFSHDKYILHQEEALKSVANVSECRSGFAGERGRVSSDGGIRPNCVNYLGKEEGLRGRYPTQPNLSKTREKLHEYGATKNTQSNRFRFEGKHSSEDEKVTGRTDKKLSPERSARLHEDKSPMNKDKNLRDENASEKDPSEEKGERGAETTLEAPRKQNLASDDVSRNLSRENPENRFLMTGGQEKEKLTSQTTAFKEPQDTKGLEGEQIPRRNRLFGIEDKFQRFVIESENSGKILTSEKEKSKSPTANVVDPAKQVRILDRQYARNRGCPSTGSFGEKPLHEQRKYLRGRWGGEIAGRRKAYSPHWPATRLDGEGNLDFNFEIIRKPVDQPAATHTYSSRWREYLRLGAQGSRNRHYEPTATFLADQLAPNPEPGSAWPAAKSRWQQIRYGTQPGYFVPIGGKGHPQSKYQHYVTRDFDSVADVWTRRISRGPTGLVAGSSPSALIDRHPQLKTNFRSRRKPSRRFRLSTGNLDATRRNMATAELSSGLENPGQPRRCRDIFEWIDGTTEGAVAARDLQLSNELLKSELGAAESKRSLASSDGGARVRPSEFDSWPTRKGVSNGRDESSGQEPSISEKELPKGFRNCRPRHTKSEKAWNKRPRDLERLKRSYATARDYVAREGSRSEVKAQGQGRSEEHGRGISRTGARARAARGKSAVEGERSQDTAHCMRFGDLWYSVYLIKKPVVAQIVGVQLFDKHGLCDGSTQWRDLTKGKMIRIGTFLPKAEDELPTISVTYVGGKTKKAPAAIDPDNYLLLIPSHVSDPTKAGYYPQFDAGPEEYLVVDSKRVSKGNDCDMIGTSFEAFARQPDRCSRPKGSCLRRQPVDLWREDMEARIRGKRGKYFVENFGTVANSPVRTYTNFTGEFLALEYYGEYTSTIEIEVKADFNAMVRKGSNAQIPTVYIDGTYPKKTRIILSVLNIGLTSSYFRPRLGDCPPDLDPAWCPLEGPLVTIPPQQRHDFRLDLSGALPPNKIHVTVQVLNQLNKKVAYRKIVIKKGDRCICAFHCKCNCIGNADGRTCHRLALEDYRGAGYIGSFPFRAGGATSASESIRTNLRVIFLTAVYILFIMGVAKGVLGLFYRRMGIAGIRVIVGPRKISKYYECELESCPVLFDDCGFPIHPTTCQPVQIVALWLEVLINLLFFFLYPLRGIWFLLVALPCCTIVIEMCDGNSGGDEGCSETEHNSSSPLLSKNPQSTCVNYAVTTVNAKEGKGDDYLPYLPYKCDDDPLEEDDTEFVLQEMKRYRKKVSG